MLKHVDASITFFGLPRFTSVPVWDRSSCLHEALMGSIQNWIALAINPKLVQIVDRLQAIPCKSVPVWDQSCSGSIQFSLV